MTAHTASVTQPLRFQPRSEPLPLDSDAPWAVAAVAELFELPFAELLHRAQTVHRQHFDPTEVELATLLSVKTGAGANSIFYGDKLLVTGNPDVDADRALLARLGMKAVGLQGRAV